MPKNSLKNIKEIFEKAKKGDKKSFSEIYEAYFKPLYRYVYLRIGNKAESDDLAQDIFIKALNSAEYPASLDSSPIFHFYDIARRSVLDWKRKRRSVVFAEDNIENYSGAKAGKSDDNPKDEEFDNFHKVLRELPDDEQDAAIFKFIGGLSSGDTESLLGVSVRTALRLEAQGLISIRDILKKQYERQL